MSGTALDRNAIIIGLRDLVAELRNSGEAAGIRLVGGAALALCYFDRGTMQDLDVLHVRPGSDDFDIRHRTRRTPNQNDRRGHGRCSHEHGLARQRSRNHPQPLRTPAGGRWLVQQSRTSIKTGV